MGDRDKCPNQSCMKGPVVFIIIIVCMSCIFSGNYIPALVVGVVAATFSLLLWVIDQVKKKKYTPNSSTESIPAALYTISATPRLSFLQASSPRRASPMPPQLEETHTNTAPPTNRPPSFSTASLSSQLSHAYYTQSSSFSSLSPYIASQSAGERHHNTSAVTPITIPLSMGQTANQSPPAYLDVVDDNTGSPPLPPPHLHTTPDAGGSYGEVFGPSSDGLPSYETVVATRQPRGDDPPPYTPS